MTKKKNSKPVMDKVLNIRRPYDPSKRQAHPECGKSITEQNHRKACDVNTIIARYQKTGLIDHIQRHGGTYGDVTGQDFKQAQDLIADQKSIFHELPAEVRAEFDNDPANYLNMVMTDEGVEELAEILDPETGLDPQNEEKPLQEENDPAKQGFDGTKDGGQEEKPVT